MIFFWQIGQGIKDGRTNTDLARSTCLLSPVIRRSSGAWESPDTSHLAP